MRLYRGKVPIIANDIVETLTQDQDIEVDSSLKEEVTLDVEAVLNEYIRAERELTERARDILSIRNLDYTYLHKIKSALAEEKAFGIGDDAINYIIKQLLEVFMHSVHVEEVYADDYTLRKKMTKILNRHLSTDNLVDQEVRKRIKNLEEGTSIWEIEYQKLREELLQKKKLI